MSTPFDRLVERQIQKAIAEGQLTGLAGEGKPLPDRSQDAFTDAATAIAGRLVAEAGALPEEFKLKRLRDAAKARYQAAETQADKHLAMALIADLQLRHAIAVEARRKFMAP